MKNKRLSLILAREKKGYSKSEVADAAGISAQRYRRIEANFEVKVDVEEAYKIANFLGYKHPKDSVYASKVGSAASVTSRLTNANGPQDITVGSTTIHLVFADNNFTYEIPISAPITVTANGNSHIHFKFQLTNMMFVETYDTASCLGVVSSNPPLLMN